MWRKIWNHHIFHHIFVYTKVLTNIDKMKLSAKAIEAIDNQKMRLMLALALGFTEVWIEKLIIKNKDNGPLTTAKALQTIRLETGLTDDLILEEDLVRVP